MKKGDHGAQESKALVHAVGGLREKRSPWNLSERQKRCRKDKGSGHNILEMPVTLEGRMHLSLWRSWRTNHHLHDPPPSPLLWLPVCQCCKLRTCSDDEMGTITLHTCLGNAALLQRDLVYKTQGYLKAVNQSLAFHFFKWKTEIPIPLLGPSKEGFK